MQGLDLHQVQSPEVHVEESHPSWSQRSQKLAKLTHKGEHPDLLYILVKVRHGAPERRRVHLKIKAGQVNQVGWRTKKERKTRYISLFTGATHPGPAEISRNQRQFQCRPEIESTAWLRPAVPKARARAKTSARANSQTLEQSSNWSMISEANNPLSQMRVTEEIFTHSSPKWCSAGCIEKKEARHVNPSVPLAPDCARRRSTLNEDSNSSHYK